MANKSRARTPQSKAKKHPAEYSREDLEEDLDRVRNVWEKVAASRERSAIHEYWRSAYQLRRKLHRLHKHEGVDLKKLVKPLIRGSATPSSGADAIRFIINATSTPSNQTPAARTKLNKLRSRYSALLEYAYKQGVKTRDVEKFIKGHGGLNFKPGKNLVSRASRSKPRKGK
jgi:hypothetical protein